jgi:hypothetical protein
MKKKRKGAQMHGILPKNQPFVANFPYLCPPKSVLADSPAPAGVHWDKPNYSTKINK